MSLEHCNGGAASYNEKVDLTSADAHRALRGANLSNKGQNVRLRLSLLMVSIGLGVAIALVRADLAPQWRWVCFLPFFLGCFGAFQGLFRTCPMHAMKGHREERSGVAPVLRNDEQGCAKRLARLVWMLSLSVSFVATWAVYAIP